MLRDYNKKELEELARIYGFKGAYKLKKAELINALTEFIPLNMEQVLVMLELEELEQLEELMIKEKPIYQAEEVLAYYSLLDLGLIGIIEMRKGSKLSVFHPVKEAYKKLDSNLIREQAKTNSHIRTYIMGLLNLYGAVQASWVCELYNRDYKLQLGENEIIAFAGKDRVVSSRSQIIDDYIVHETMYNVEEENFYQFLRLIIDKNYYVPDHSYIKLMSDELYYDNTLQVQKLKSYIKKNFTQDEEVIEEAVFTVVMYARVDCNENNNSISFMLEEWNDMGIIPRDLSQANETLQHIVSVINTTRRWMNKGYTPAEIILENKVGNTVGTPAGAQKAKVRKLDVGRNQLCPCGSGEKYKKCCGKTK